MTQSNTSNESMAELIGAARTLLMDYRRAGYTSLPVSVSAASEAQAQTCSTQATGSATLQDMAAQVQACRQCGLHQHRNKTVFGVGAMQADLMVIAPAPTPEDDLKGKPLMGATGQLFAKMVSAIGLTSSQIYMTPVVKCRPNQKDEVTTDQWKQCRRYWLSQVQHVQPAMILALGEVAGRSVADQENASLDSLRSNTYSVEGIPALVTHAPDFLLAHPAAKKEAWEDMKNLHAMICKRTGKKLSRKG